MQDSVFTDIDQNSSAWILGNLDHDSSNLDGYRDCMCCEIRQRHLEEKKDIKKQWKMLFPTVFNRRGDKIRMT